MNTKQIEFILELAKTQNFNKAAENLGVSQPTMTYQIKSAEKEIGFDIFDRSGKGAVLTPAGSQFAGQLKSIYESLRSAIEQGQNFSRSVKDDIRIAMPIRSAVYFLPEAIRRFSSQYPAVSVTPLLIGMDARIRSSEGTGHSLRDGLRNETGARHQPSPSF